MARPVAGAAGSTVGAAGELHYRAGMSSPDPNGDLARFYDGNEDSTAEIPVLIVDDVMPVAEIVTARARVGIPRLSHEATVPIAIPANLLGDEPVERPTLLLMFAVHGTFLAAAVVLVAVLMAIAAR
jgi:hypothetical protein